MSSESSSSDRSPISTVGSTFSNSDPPPKLTRQCSIQHVVHKNFLEPICDDCLLEELGLQPELGPILGGRDLQEGLHGEEWILESSVEINVEDPDDDRIVSTGFEDDDDDAADADDEGEFRGRSGRRQGMDISRDALRISSDLSVDEQESLALFREQLRDTEPEARKMPMTVIKTTEADRHLRQRWSQQFRKGFARRRKDDKRAISTSPAHDRSTNFSSRSSVASSWKDHGLRARPTSPIIAAQHPSPILPKTVRDASLDAQDEMTSLYETNQGEDTEENASCPSWSQHLQADLQDRQARKTIDLTAAVPNEAIFDGPRRSPSLIRSSPQIATPRNFASWLAPNLQTLNVSSSWFDKDDATTPPHPSSHAHADIRATSVDSTLSISTFSTPRPSPSSPSSTRSTTATSTTAKPQPQPQTQTQLSLHPLSTALSISTPHRPALTPRTSSLRSPPASSPLLHSSPPLHQSPTSVFVCVHERWAFIGCGCEGPSWVRSCVCEPAPGPIAEDEREKREEADVEDVDLDVDAKDGCRAAQPVVRTRWFFNQSCETCLASHDDDDDAAPAAGGLTQ